MVVFMPFVLWLFLNAACGRMWPRLALARGELLTIFTMLWVVGALPQWGWSDYWIAIIGAPFYMATPENQWSDLLFPYLPWRVFPDSSPRVLDTFWMGLPQGAAVPWDGWVGAIIQWLGASLGMVVFGFCLVVLFQRQWMEAEKLSFPLAQMPLDLTRGFDGPRRVPDLFCSGLFWIGCGVVLLPLLYNIGAYFTPGLPLFELYTKRFHLELPQPFSGLTIRVLPLVMALTYLCPLDILGSLVVFALLATVKIGLMDRVGLVVGAEGQPLAPQAILSLESLGPIVFVACWSVYLARRHLREVWRQVCTGEGDRRQVGIYRLALVGLILSALYVIAWACSLGASLPLATGAFVLMVSTFFVTIKLIAATGFPYLMPSWPNAKGSSFIVDLVGSARLSPQDLVAFKMFTGHAFFGNIRLPAWPAHPAPSAHFLATGSAVAGDRYGASRLCNGFSNRGMGQPRDGLRQRRGCFSDGCDRPLRRNSASAAKSQSRGSGEVGRLGLGLIAGGRPSAVTGPLSLVLAPSHWAGLSAYLGHIHLLVQPVFGLGS